MLPSYILIAGFIATSSASLLIEDRLFATLLKRQEPGTPEYNCHDNCGTAITVSKARGNFCTDEVFLYDYENCLQCAGPDNVDIWKYYGGSLAKAAATCNGLAVEPKSGKQADVGEAKHPVDGSEDASSVVSSAAPSTTAAVESPAPASLSSGVEPVASSTVLSVQESAAPIPTVSGSLYPTGNGTINGTAPTASAPLTQPSNGAEIVQMRNVVALIGAVAAVGAFY